MKKAEASASPMTGGWRRSNKQPFVHGMHEVAAATLTLNIGNLRLQGSNLQPFWPGWRMSKMPGTWRQPAPRLLQAWIPCHAY